VKKLKNLRLLVSLAIILLSVWAIIPSQITAVPENSRETNPSSTVSLDPELKEIAKDTEGVSHFIVTTSSFEKSRIKNILYEMRDVEITNEFNFIDGVSIKASRNGIEKIENIEGVTGIWKDHAKYALGFPSRDYDEYTFHADTPVSPNMAYSVERIEAPSVWNLGYDGENVTIAVLDTGIAWDHETFFYHDENGTRIGDTKVIANVSFVPWEEPGYDLNGHGTHCAGIAAGTGGPSGKYRGVAPNANLVSVKIGCSEGYGYDSWIIGGIEWVIKNKDIYNVKIISFSFGGPGFPEDPLSMAINRAVDEGILFSASAGNEGPDWGTVHGPGWAVNAVTVGATTKEDTIAELSGRGPIDPYGSQSYGYPAVATPHQGRIEPDVVAPGVNIMSADAWDPEGYVAFSGTSMSCPHVAGAAAVLFSVFPSATPEMIRVALTVSATDLGYSPFEQGDGRLNLGAAYDAMVTLGKLGILSWEELGSKEPPNSTGLNHVLGKNTYFHVTSNNSYAEYSNAGVTEPWAFMGGTVGAVIDEYGRIWYDYIYTGGYAPETLHCIYWRFHIYYNGHGLGVTDCTPIVEYVNYNSTYMRVTKWLLTPFNDAVVGITWIFNGTYAEYWKNTIQVSATIMSVDGDELKNVALAWVNGYNYDPFDAEPYLDPYRTTYDTATNTMIITPLNHRYTPRTHKCVDDKPTITISSSLEPFGYSACNQRHGWDLIWYTPGPWENETGPVIGQANPAVKWTFGNVFNATVPITFGIGVNQSVAMEMSEKGKTMPSHTPQFPEWGPDVRVELKGQVVTSNSTQFELVTTNPSSVNSSSIYIELMHGLGNLTIEEVAAFGTNTSSIEVDLESLFEPKFPEGFLPIVFNITTQNDVSQGDQMMFGEIYLNCVPVVFGPGLYWHLGVGSYNGFSQECLLTVVTPIPMNIALEPFLNTFANTSVGLEKVEAGLVFGPYIYDFTLYSNTTTSFEDMEIIGLQANEHWIAWHEVWCRFESGYGGNAMPVITDVSLSDTVISLMEDTLLITAGVSDLETPPQDLTVQAEILYLDWYGYTYMPKFSYSDQSYVSQRYITNLHWNPVTGRFEGSVDFTTADTEGFFEGLYCARILVIDPEAQPYEIVDSPVKQFRIDDKPPVLEEIKLDERIMDVGSVKPATNQSGFVYPRPIISASVGLAYQGIPQIQILVTSTLLLNLADVDFEGVSTSEQLTVIVALFDYQTGSPIFASNVTYNNATDLYELDIELPIEDLTYVGVYELDIFVTDADGSVSATWFPVRITVDTTKPVAEITSPSAETVVTGDVTVTFIATDKNLRNVTYSIDGATPVDVAGETSFTLDTTILSDGRHVITLAATDVMRLQSSTSLPLIVDNTSPTLSILSPRNNTVVPGIVDVTFVALDATLANASLITDDRAFDVTGETFFTLNTTELPDGVYTIKLSVFDSAGNDAETSITIIIDNTPPTAAVLSPEEDTFVSGTINVTFSFGDDNLESATLLLDGKILSDVTHKTFHLWNTTQAADGNHILTLTVMDKAGNSENIERMVTVDNTSPTAEIREPAENAYLRSSYTVIIYGYDVNLNLMKLDVDGASVKNWTISDLKTYSWDTTTLDDGFHRIRLIVDDKAGNSKTIETAVTVDNIKPVVDVTNAEELNRTELTGTITIGFTAIDTNLKSAQLVIDGIVFSVTGETHLWDTTKVGDGTHTIKLVACDMAGNINETAISVTTVNVKREVEATRNLYLGVGTPVGFIIGAIIFYAITRKRSKSPSESPRKRRI
jgi:subtilisin family serine protease